jgi:hypothetical protein
MNNKITITLGLLLVPIIVEASTSPVGTWKYDAPDAAYEYSSGKIIVASESNAYLVKVEVNGQTIPAGNVKYADNQLSFTIYVESQLVSLNIKVEANSMKGVASYSEGELVVTATRE